LRDLPRHLSTRRREIRTRSSTNGSRRSSSPHAR
jgi:hypothetical protein